MKMPTRLKTQRTTINNGQSEALKTVLGNRLLNYHFNREIICTAQLICNKQTI